MKRLFSPIRLRLLITTLTKNHIPATAIILTFLFTGFSITGFAQDKPVPEYKTNYWSDLPGYVEAQSHYSLDLANKLLKKSPPSTGESIDRDAALTLIDQVEHLVDAPSLAALQVFYHQRIKSMLSQLKTNTRTKSGATIYKLYNHGFIVRSANATYAFDFYPGPRGDGFALDDSLTVELVKACDVLFVSHWHPDHADEFVARTFIAQGKPVVTPDSVWYGKDFYGKVLHPVRDIKKLYPLKLQNGKTVQFATLPGHQGKTVINNNYVIKDSENLCFAQTGDQDNPDDFSWINNVHNNFKIDLLFPNCWTLDLPRMIRGFAPKMVIPGHNNELGHTFDHREAYWMNNMRAGEFKDKLINLTWGEIYEYNTSK